jgi:peptidoglycan/LPS O-acetylase OafA/YrhL
VLRVADISYRESSLFYYFFFAANVPYAILTAIPFLEHYWSLGVEEQFYAFYPWIVANTSRLFRTLGLITIGLIALKVILRLVEIRYGLSTPYDIAFLTRFQCMLIGAMGAVLFHRQSGVLISLATNKLVQIISWGCILLCAFNSFHVLSIFDHELMSVIAVCIVVSQATGGNLVLNLERPLFDFLGKISYGIYVLHPLVIYGLSFVLRPISSGVIKYLVVYGAALIGTILVAWVSYTFFEKRFLRLKLKYSTVRSYSSREEMISSP